MTNRNQTPSDEWAAWRQDLQKEIKHPYITRQALRRSRCERRGRDQGTPIPNKRVTHFTPKENTMPAEKSEKKEYKNEDYAKRLQKQWEKKGYKVTRRKNVLYLKKG